jgi:hypothetical protein
MTDHTTAELLALLGKVGAIIEAESEAIVGDRPAPHSIAERATELHTTVDAIERRMGADDLHRVVELLGEAERENATVDARALEPDDQRRVATAIRFDRRRQRSTDGGVFASP